MGEAIFVSSRFRALPMMFLLLLHPTMNIAAECTIKLTGGRNALEGRVDCVTDGMTKKTVCGEGWSLDETRIVCRELGLESESANFKTNEAVEELNFIMWNCSRSEPSLSSCTNIECKTYTEVMCAPNHFCDNCESLEVRLENGNSPYEGRVEICLNNQWTTVCGNHWGTAEAKTVCRQLGFSNDNAKVGYFGEGIGDYSRYTFNCSQLTLPESLYSCNTSMECNTKQEWNSPGVICEDLSDNTPLLEDNNGDGYPVGVVVILAFAIPLTAAITAGVVVIAFVVLLRWKTKWINSQLNRNIEENEDSEIDNTNYNISITDETNKPDESEEVDLLCNNPIYESKEIDQCCDNPIYETMKNDPAYETLESVACNYEEAAKSMRALTPQRNDDTYAYLTSST